MIFPSSRCFFLLAAGAVVGCEQPIDLGEEGASRIVINSQLKVGSAVQIDMRVINSFGGIAEAPQLEETVGVISGSDGTEDTLEVRSSNLSVAILGSETLLVEEGVTYDLKLVAPGFAPLTSVTTVPEAARFYSPPQGDATGESTGDSTVLSVGVSFEDVRDADNYFYLLLSIAEGQGGTPIPATQGVLLSGGRTLESQDGTWLFDDRAFADDVFDGTIVLDAEALSAYANPTAVIELRTASRAYYNLLLDERRRDRRPVRSQGGSPDADNVLGGGGVFGSYSVSYLTQALR